MRGEDGQLLRLDGSKIKLHHAFKDWQHSLKKGERLPRGRYFKGKKPGKPVVMFDEFHTLFDHTAFRGKAA
ncbi:TPA: hypothetical protein QHW61_005215 [Klebsiella oxytoca]|nr:hypothetical protein [Klebsiella oxytoca]